MFNDLLNVADDGRQERREHGAGNEPQRATLVVYKETE
jgi:hypothetical protein